jgi:hypothetical protein
VKDWFVEHTNKPIITAFYILAALNLIGGFIGYFATYYGIVGIGVIILIAFIFNISITISLSWEMYTQRAIPLKHLSWLIIPSAIFTLFTYVGYVIFNALG